MTYPFSKYYFYRLIWAGLDLLLPPICGGCSKPGSRWCSGCQQNVLYLAEPFCIICGIPLNKKGDICPDCKQERPCYRILRSWSAFEDPVKSALHRLKYRRDIGLGDALAAQLIDFVSYLNWPIDLIVPVPLGQKRLDERGYNQVGLIARPLSFAMNIEYAPRALSRDHETRSQVGLTKLERHINVHGAFNALEKYVNDRIILLIDDVATTGSTLSSCAEALYAAGARDVFALTVARALAHHGWQGV
jgi:competence protein ComFC